jgi:DNA-binding transcriptional regulator PaaX
MRKSKYPSLGILDAIFRLTYGGTFTGYEDLCGELRSDNKSKRRVLTTKLYRLKRGNFIERSSVGYHLTEKGLDRINLEKLRKLKIKEKRTDDLWRVIIFDVPEYKKLSRNILREKLREFDCKLVQKSVFVTRYICEREIRLVAELLGIKDNVLIILAKSLGESEKKFAKYYKI